MDDARKKTDRILNNLEKRVGVLYDSDPKLLRAEQRYVDYMDYVGRAVADEYNAYINAPYGPDRDRLKQEYADAVLDLTDRNKEYTGIVRDICEELARVNQKALNLINAEMPNIYTINYNQVASDCKRVGIKVNG